MVIQHFLTLLLEVESTYFFVFSHRQKKYTKPLKTKKTNKQTKKKQKQKIKGGIFCGDTSQQSLSQMTQTEKCAKINELLNSQYKCYCGAIGLIYPHIDDPNYKTQLSIWWTNFVTSLADQYSTQFGDCDITFQCDLTTGTVLSTVTVTTVEFTMTFPTTLTLAEVRAIVAATLSIPESWITVTLSTRRRLQTTQTASVTIEFTGSDATKAGAIKTEIDSGTTNWVDSSGNTVSGVSSTTANVDIVTEVFFCFVLFACFFFFAMVQTKNMYCANSHVLRWCCVFAVFGDRKKPKNKKKRKNKKKTQKHRTLEQMQRLQRLRQRLRQPLPLRQRLRQPLQQVVAQDQQVAAQQQQAQDQPTQQEMAAKDPCKLCQWLPYL